MKINFNIDKEQLKTVGKGAWRLTKAIGFEGSKVLLGKALMVSLDTTFKGGASSIKDIRLDDVIGKEKPKQPKKKLFSKDKNEAEELIDEIKELSEKEDGEVVSHQ